jgi:hypothetical protein
MRGEVKGTSFNYNNTAERNECWFRHAISVNHNISFLDISSSLDSTTWNHSACYNIILVSCTEVHLLDALGF